MSKAARSSNGRTHPSGGCYLGSSPSLAALFGSMTKKAARSRLGEPAPRTRRCCEHNSGAKRTELSATCTEPVFHTSASLEGRVCRAHILYLSLVTVRFESVIAFLVSQPSRVRFSRAGRNYAHLIKFHLIRIRKTSLGKIQMTPHLYCSRFKLQVHTSNACRSVGVKALIVAPTC